MASTQREDASGFFVPRLVALPNRAQASRKGRVWITLLAWLVMLSTTTALWSQRAYDVEGGDELQPRLDELDRIIETLQGWRKYFLWGGAALLGIALLKIINPINLYYNAGDRALRRAVRTDRRRGLADFAARCLASGEANFQEELLLDFKPRADGADLAGGLDYLLHTDLRSLLPRVAAGALIIQGEILGDLDMIRRDDSCLVTLVVKDLFPVIHDTAVVT